MFTDGVVMVAPAECELLGYALKWARTQAKMTSRQLALASGVSIGYIGMLENGRRRNPRWAIVTALAAALAVNPTDLAVPTPARSPRRSTDPPDTPDHFASGDPNLNGHSALTTDSDVR